MRRTLGILLASLVALTGCVGDGTESACESAAAQLTTCSDDQRAAFVDSCEASGLTEVGELTAEDATAACTAAPDDGKTDAATAVVMGACISGMYAVKWGVALRSPSGQPLPTEMKNTLRPLYGSLVDEVRVSFPAKLPPAITIAGHELSIEPGAQTFGNNIFISGNGAVATNATFRFYTVIHEMAHSRQAKNAGGFYGFAVNYCRDMIAAGFKYDRINMEVQAYRTASDAETNMNRCGHVVCP